MERYSYFSNAISIKKELLVSTAATNLITIITNIPINQPYNKTLYQYAYGTDPVLALYYYIPLTN